MKQYLIQFKSGPNRGETIWARRDGDEYVRHSCIGMLIRHTADEVTVLAVREA